MMKQHGPRTMRGFSLVEMVAALMIFGLAAGGVIEVYTLCIRSTSSSLGYTHAVFLAQKALEEMLVEGALIPGSDEGDFDPEHPEYSWKSEVEETDQVGLYEVRIVVTWTERGREKEYVLTTLAAERS